MQTTDEKKVIETEIQPMLKLAAAVVIKNELQKQEAVSLVKSMNDLKDRIEEKFHFIENTSKAHKLWKASKDTENVVYVPIDDAITQVKKIVKSYETEVAIAQQREVQALEAKRLQREREEREKLEEQAKKAEAKGKTEKAEQLREAAQNVQVMTEFTPPAAPTKKLVWKCECTNLFLLCKAIVSGQVPFSVVEIRQSALNDFAKNYDGKTQIDGLKFKQEVSR